MSKPLSETFRLGLMVAALALAAVASAGCSSLGKSVKSLVSGKDPEPARKVTTPRFSETENLRVAQEPRQYKRMNRARFEEEADVSAGAGSLWVMEGQGAYLFSQNQMRMVGDLLNVKIEGGAKQQLQTKVRVITRLLDRLENPMRGLASSSAPQAAGNQNSPTAQGQKENPAAGKDGEKEEKSGESVQAKSDSPFAVQTVPTRIVEQLKDGSYRVRGVQPFMIGKREYKVIVTGVVRPEDFDDSGIDSSKLLDSQMDIVSSRKGASL